MTDLVVVTARASEWQRLKALVLDSVSSPITKRVYNLGLDEFIAWYTREPEEDSQRRPLQPGACIWNRVGSVLSLLMSGSRLFGS